MTTQTALSSNAHKAMKIIKNAAAKGWMSEEEHLRTQAKLRKLGFAVVVDVAGSSGQSPATNKAGWAFFEVSIHPFVERVADENGGPVDGDWFNPCTDDLSGYSDAMFRKGWSVSSWVRDGDDDDDGGEIDVEDDEEFPDYETAITRAEELAALYRVEIDHRY